jgi:hypothetical protein
MIFTKKSVNIFDSPELRGLYTAKGNGCNFIIKEIFKDRNVIFRLQVFKNDELIYEKDNHTTLYDTKIVADAYYNKMRQKDAKPPVERDINTLYKEKTRKISSIKSKTNSLIKKYPDDKSIMELKLYIDTIL